MNVDVLVLHIFLTNVVDNNMQEDDFLVAFIFDGDSLANLTDISRTKVAVLVEIQDNAVD